MYTALRATSLTLANFLEQRFAQHLVLASKFNGNGMSVSLNNPQEMAEHNIEGVSLWLYRVVRDAQRLNAPPERISQDQLKRTPLPFCLYYLVTPVVSVLSTEIPASPETEQLILGKVLQTFHDYPYLHGSTLSSEFAGTEVEIRIRLFPMDLEELTRVWDALERTFQLCVSYEVSVVYLESEHQPQSTVPVKVAIPDYGVIVSGEES